MDTLIKINSISKSYKNKKVLNDISFQIQRGQVFGILGPNGSGKTTTLKIILGLLRQNSGDIDYSFYKNHDTFIKKTGVALEYGGFDPVMNAVQNLKIACHIKRVPFSKIDELLSLVELDNNKKLKYKKYSLGMKQRLSIASCLLGDPEFVILDEPTNGLDPIGIIQVRNSILNLSQMGKTFLIASHLLGEMQQVCSHIIIINKGNSVYCGAMSEVLKAYKSLEDAFISLTKRI